MLSYWHGTGTVPLLGMCVSEVLDRSAELHPDNDALIVRRQARR